MSSSTWAPVGGGGEARPLTPGFKEIEIEENEEIGQLLLIKN
jgi:hypothetical protein